MAISWSRPEVQAAVHDYFCMLLKELRGEAYNKTVHRSRLAEQLADRRPGAIERRHQNISAVLIDLGLPYIDGYKPLGNYQALLLDVIEDYLEQQPDILAALVADAEQALPQPVQKDLFLSGVVVDPPRHHTTHPPKRHRLIRKIWRKYDFVAGEAQNSRLARAGRMFVVDFEAERLTREGSPALVKKITALSMKRDSHAGYDIRSFEAYGRERFISVKTTRWGRRFPFLVSHSELARSREYPDQYYLYRVFNFAKEPRLFMLQGPLADHVALSPKEFQARFE